MTGTVTTFYSYKGGVGRSFALANIGVLLSKWGFRVLCIDFDLEAPGLAHFFSSVENGSDEWLRNGPGLVELFDRFKRERGAPIVWKDYVRRLDHPSLGGISLIKAGLADDGYNRRLRRLNWTSLYRQGLGIALERMFNELREEFDYVLIDARTGVTDFSGIITAQLPDILVILFTANEQSLKGSIEVALRADEVRNSLALDRSRLLVLPIPARFETQFEHRIAMAWRDRFALELQPFYKGWAGRNDAPDRLVQVTTIPYVPYWTFGERLSVVEDGSSDPLNINYSMETLAALLAHRLSQAGLLLESRDDFVAAARRIQQGRAHSRKDVFLSYDHVNTFAAEELRVALSNRGLSVFMDTHDMQPGVPVEAALKSAIEQSDHMLVLVGDRTQDRHWQSVEIRMFLRQAASDNRSRFIVPVLIDGTPQSAIPEVLRQYRVITADLDFDAAAEQVLQVIRPTTATADFSRARKCFLSFHYVQDVWRVQQLRNMTGIESQPLLSAGAWQKIRLSGDTAIADWIQENMRSKECLIVLIGAETADRKWVRYEIEQAWLNGLGVLGIYIHNLKDHEGQRAVKGANPFEDIVVGGRTIECEVYDPPYSDSGAVYEYIKANVGEWISKAVGARARKQV